MKEALKAVFGAVEYVLVLAGVSMILGFGFTAGVVLALSWYAV